MNGLVGYTSSDEEDSENIPPTITQHKADENLHNTASQGTRIVSEPSFENAELSTTIKEPVLGPVLGPSVSAVDKGVGDDYDYENLDLEDMSEQDILRYLTSATHPMTEMPPSPPGSPNMAVAKKFARFMDLKSKGIHFNEDLAQKNAFKNPALLASLIDRSGLEGYAQYNSTLPAHVFDPASFPAFAFKESLLKSQNTIRTGEEAEKKARSAAGKRTINFEPESKSRLSSRNSTPGLQPSRHRV